MRYKKHYVLYYNIACDIQVKIQILLLTAQNI